MKIITVIKKLNVLKKYKERRVFQLKHTVNMILGYSGVMVYYSKSGYRDLFPRNIVVFNANIFTKKHGKIWYGDIDITLAFDKLVTLAKALKTDVYVLSEYDGRFENEKKPKYDYAICTISPNGLKSFRKSLGNVYRENDGKYKLGRNDE